MGITNGKVEHYVRTLLSHLFRVNYAGNVIVLQAVLLGCLKVQCVLSTIMHQDRNIAFLFIVY